MNQLNSLVKAFIVCACLFSQHTFAQTIPAEKKISQIKRNSASGNLLIGSLSKNLFKVETVKVPYTVSVPYQETETYVEQVPYQETETYTETVPYQVDVPYTEYVTDYRQEYKCHPVTRYREECRNEQRCYTVPGDQQCRMVEECGVNVNGQRICKTRQVCTGGGPTQRCDNQRICQNVAYTDQDCRYENVPYQHEVTRYRSETRYRQETRTRTVTKYRSETRTRTVTKYRDEQRCCRDEQKTVFDRQLQYQIEVRFPVEAELTGDQTEVLNIVLTAADENTAHVELQVLNSVYGYVIANQEVSGATIRVDLAAVEKTTLSQSDLATLTDYKRLVISLGGEGIDSALVIQDLTSDFSDVTTEYAIFLDLQTDDGNKPLNTRSFTRAQVKAAGGQIKMADVIQNANSARNALVAGNTIVYSVIAKRTGTSPLIAGKILKAQKLDSFLLR